MAPPLIIPNYDKIPLAHSVEVARLNDGNIYNITVKYQPPGMFSPTLNIRAEYDGKYLRVKEVDIVDKRGVHTRAIQYFRKRVSEMEILLKDEIILGYIDGIFRGANG